MLGSSYRDESFEMLTAKGSDLVDLSEQAWYLHNANNIDVNSVDDDGVRLYGLSYFGRVSYNYDNRYLLYATMRADGTSKYQEKWGYFPAFGAGWVVSEEEFLNSHKIIDFLKIRAGWGRLGNDKLASSSGSNTTSLVQLALNDVLYSGSQSSNTFDYLTWESTDEMNFGFTGRFLKEKLSVDADYYIRDTKDAVIRLGTLKLKNQRWV